MNKTNYPSFTNYLSKTHKNADLYRLVNPDLLMAKDVLCFDSNLYAVYFTRHKLSKRNVLTLAAIYFYSSIDNYNNTTNKETIRLFVKILKASNRYCFCNQIKFRGGNIIINDVEISWFTLNIIYKEIEKLKQSLYFAYDDPTRSYSNAA